MACAQFHPDGHLFAAGGVDGQIKLFDVITGTGAANFETSGPVEALSFSENGIWLASVVQGSASISIWDLRKLEQIKVFEVGGQVSDVRWDYTGQFLATAGPNGVTIQQYSKSAKTWSEPLKSAIPAKAVGWGANAQKLVAMDSDVLTVLASS